MAIAGRVRVVRDSHVGLDEEEALTGGQVLARHLSGVESTSRSDVEQTVSNPKAGGQPDVPRGLEKSTTAVARTANEVRRIQGDRRGFLPTKA